MSANATRPDLLFGYGAADLDALFTAYGPGGRTAYAGGLVVDTAYPLALAAATVLLAARALPARARWLWAFPVLFAVLDVIENIGGVALAAHPRTLDAIVAVLSPITQVKLLSFPPTVAVLHASAGALSWRRVRDRRSAPHGRPWLPSAGPAAVDPGPRCEAPRTNLNNTHVGATREPAPSPMMGGSPGLVPRPYRADSSRTVVVRPAEGRSGR